MGGIMKGGHGHMHAAYSSRKRWINVYVVMVIVCVVFGCGLLGLMGLHRLKERRFLNLLIKEKDDQILSLHLLLQKEREHLQEAKRKTEEMKMKIFNLGARKTELNGRVLAMESTISSLRDEQRAIELAYQEKQNEAKLLREQYMEIKDQNRQVKALTEVLPQREAEIEDLKHRLQFCGAKVGSMSVDKHSILPENITAKANMSGSETMIDENNNMNDDSRYRETESSTQSDEHGENGRSINGRSETDSKEGFKRLENSQERRGENGRTNADRGNESVGRSETGVEKNEHETEKIGSLGKEEQKKPREEDAEAHFTDSKEVSTTGDAHSRRISKSQRSNNQDLEVHKRLEKLEMQENSHRFRGKHGYLKRAKGKRWRPIAKQTEGKKSSRSNGASTMGDQGLVGGMEEIGDQHEEGKPKNQDKNQNSIIGLRMQNESVSRNQQSEIDDEQSKEHEITTTEHAENNNDGQHDNRLGQKEVAETNEDADGIQMEHFEENELGEDSEEKEQTDEPEF